MEKEEKRRNGGKVRDILFVALCLSLCLIPFAGMAVAPTNETTENRELAAFPSLKEEGSWNKRWLSEAGDYCEEHFAFRPFFVAADSWVQGSLFGVSNMDTIIDGTDGWLYYKATLDDFLGQNLFSERKAYNIAHNLSLVSQYVQSKGASFLFTVPPNKNSLYGEHMPYYAREKVGDAKNIEFLKPYLEKENVLYTDLFSLFQEEKEILYLKRDSHWNQKGAALAYNAMMDALGYSHETFETVKAVRTKTEYGDLNKMMYPKWAIPEWNYDYEYQWKYQYGTDTKTVEEPWIEASCPKGEKSLLMFRDSFGNTLLPFFANAFQKSYFSKGEPYQLGAYMEKYQPKTVIIEKVERNLGDLGERPPVMPGIAIGQEWEAGKDEAKTKTTLEIKESEYDLNYWEISGVADSGYIKPESEICVSVQQGEKMEVYKAFHISSEQSDYGYRLCLPKDLIEKEDAEISVFVKDGEQSIKVKKQKFAACVAG